MTPQKPNKKRYNPPKPTSTRPKTSGIEKAGNNPPPPPPKRKKAGNNPPPPPPKQKRRK
jgi:hypothetical protein